MKSLMLFFFIFAGVHGWGQVDTLNPLTQKQIADSIYNSLNQYVQTGKLHNRLMFDDTTYSLSLNTNSFFSANSEKAASVDDFYGLIYELKNMSIDTSTIADPINIFNRISQRTNDIEFSESQIIYPLGIIDFNFNLLNTVEQTTFGNITIDNQVIHVNNGAVQLETRNTHLIAPMYEFLIGNRIGLELSEENFFSNYRTFSDISTFLIVLDNTSYNIKPDEPFFFYPKNDSIQLLKVQLIYQKGDTIEHFIMIRTPELGANKNNNKSNSNFPDCTSFRVNGNEYIDIAGNQISWCLLPRCDYDGRILKPYFLLTGYRPPIIAQSFETTYKYYNDEHDQLIEKLRANNYDVFIVRFNIHAKPFTHGMQESADLLIKFIEAVNIAKNMNYGHENVIQGSSMSADIANLALLKMEKKHLEDNTYQHHHSRLFIAYDANFYGANLPLAYQYQILSFVRHPQFNNFFTGVPALGTTITIYNTLRYAMALYLNSTLDQKTVKELLQYHSLANNPLIFSSPVCVQDYTPTHHQLRQNYYEALDEFDNGTIFLPYAFGYKEHSNLIRKNQKHEFL